MDIKPYQIMKYTISLILLILLLPVSGYGQEQPTADSDTLRKDALNVYMEASDYVKKEIPFLNYVRDIKDCDVFIISTTRRTGSGGTEYTYFLEGRGRFEGQDDTISFSSSPDDTQDKVRAEAVSTLKQGIMRYVVKTPLSKFIDISFNQPINDEVSTDKWNSWVFRISANGFMFGQSTYSTIDAFGGITASRVTNDWKINISTDYSYGRDWFDIDGEDYESITTSRSAEALIVKSIGDHWSYGGSAEVGSSSYNNYQLRASFMPGIEYDVFPYAESTRHQFRFLYSLGYAYNNYVDTTIYDKLNEGLMIHSLRSAFEVVQKWGSIDFSVMWLNHLRDWSENYLSIDGSVSWRIAKGLNINLGGSFSFIHNQISLIKGGATTEEILLRQKELKTDFSYFANFGFTYTFGSIYNNVVNPRFGSSGRRTIIISN